MVEMVASLFATAGTAAATAAPAAAATAATAATTAATAAGTAGTLASAASIGSTALSVLQGGASALSILSGLGAANAEASQLRMQANNAKLDQISERAANIDRTTALKKELLSSIGDSDVAYAASGVDISSGVAAEARAYAQDRASREISIDGLDTDARVASLEARRRGYKSLAKGAKRAGYLKAAAGTLSTAFDIAERA